MTLRLILSTHLPVGMLREHRLPRDKFLLSPIKKIQFEIIRRPRYTACVIGPPQSHVPSPEHSNSKHRGSPCLPPAGASSFRGSSRRPWHSPANAADALASCSLLGLRDRPPAFPS